MCQFINRGISRVYNLVWLGSISANTGKVYLNEREHDVFVSINIMRERYESLIVEFEP